VRVIGTIDVHERRRRAWAYASLNPASPGGSGPDRAPSAGARAPPAQHHGQRLSDAIAAAGRRLDRGPSN